MNQIYLSDKWLKETAECKHVRKLFQEVVSGQVRQVKYGLHKKNVMRKRKINGCNMLSSIGLWYECPENCVFYYNDDELFTFYQNNMTLLTIIFILKTEILLKINT